MPMNNNQKGQQSAVARLSRLPVVLAASTKLSVLYSYTKRSHPHLRAACQALESGATVLYAAAIHRVSPVVAKLEPQISSANGVACKSLDWLETRFPVVHAPTEQIVAMAKDKMEEVCVAVSIAANGTASCVQHTVAWAMIRMQQADEGQTLVERAVGVAAEGLQRALTEAEALLDRALPPTEPAAHDDPASERAALVSFPARLLSLTVKLCRRTRHMVETKIHCVKVTETWWWSSVLVRGSGTSWLTWVLQLQQLPQSLQHQVVSALFFFSQMRNLTGPTPPQNQQNRPPQAWPPPGEAQASTPHRAVVPVHSKALPPPHSKALPPPHRLRAGKGSEKKGGVRR